MMLKASARRGPLWATAAGVTLAALVAAAPAARAETAAPEEARISLDVKDADLVDIVRVLADVAAFQVVFDPGINCRLTLKLREVRWSAALDASLKSCGLAQEEEGGIVRIAPASRLAAEADDERRLKEARSSSREPHVATFRLSYARAQEMAPLVKRLLSPRGDVVYDTRTNTLIVID
jgi:type IV pilus assembly protein PilQ